MTIEHNDYKPLSTAYKKYGYRPRVHNDRALRAIVSGCDLDKYCGRIMVLTLARQVFSRFVDGVWLKQTHLVRFRGKQGKCLFGRDLLGEDACTGKDFNDLSPTSLNTSRNGERGSYTKANDVSKTIGCALDGLQTWVVFSVEAKSTYDSFAMSQIIDWPTAAHVEKILQ
jgi:hypothetical protein